MKVHFRPVAKPAPPRPRRPDALIWSQIHSGVWATMSFVPFQPLDAGQHGVEAIEQTRAGQVPQIVRCKRG